MTTKTLRKKVLSLFLATSIAISGISFSNLFTSQVSAAQANIYYNLATNIQDGVILHCFDWTYQQIIDELPAIKEAGFTSVQTSPAQQSCSGYAEWYFLYQPNNFYVGSSGLGNEDDLKRLCREADKYGIKVIVDVVANHLAGDHSNIDPDLKPGEYWHYQGSIDYNNRYQITHGDIGMKDLNSEHYFVQSKVKNYIQQLKNDGVDGIRWDAAKHISLPSESCQFWSSVIDNSMYNYGEILDMPVNNNQSFANSLIKEYTNYMSVTDNTFSADILRAITNGNVSGSIGYWTQVAKVSDNKVVYWGESHDTYSNDTYEGGWTKYIDQNKIDRAYAIVASKNNSTSLYLSRPYQTQKSAIKAGQKGSTHFTSKEVAAVNHLHNLCIGEPDYYTTSNNIAVTTRKSGASIVLGSGSNRYVTVPNGGSLTTPGTYYDEITGNQFTVTSSTISGQVGNTGIAVIYKYTGSTPTTEVPTSVAPTTETPSVVPSTEENNTLTRTVYVDISDCSWFINDNAVAVVKSNTDNSYKKMNTTVINGKTVYSADIKSSASSLKIARMLPSGNIYNETPITLSLNNNYYKCNSSLSSYTSSNITIVVPSTEAPSIAPTAEVPSTEAPSVVPSSTDFVENEVTIYFTNNYNWDNVYVYYWGTSKSENWPGKKMRYVSRNEYNQKVYKITIPSNVKGLLFNNGNGSQTVDITTNISNNQGFYISGSNGKYQVGTYKYAN